MIALVALFLVALTGPASADPLSAFILTSIGIAATKTAVALTTFALTAIASVGVSFLQTKLFAAKPKKQTPTNIDSSINVTTRQSLAPRRLVYGKTRLGGTIVYVATTDNNAYLHMVVVFCEGEIDGYEAIYFNDTQVTLDTGIVTTEPYYSGGNAYATIALYYGTEDQGADTILQSYLPSAWTDAHRLTGCAYMYVRLLWNSNVFAQGLPNISAVIRGQKVYDPRTGTRYWTDNAALCVRDYLLRPFAKGGVGAHPAEIHEQNLINQANICDEYVQLGNGTAERRYTLNGVIQMDSQNSPQSTLESMLTASAGAITWTAGIFYLFVGAYRTPSLTITEDVLIGALKIQPRRPLREQFNAIKGSFVNPAARYEASDYPAITSPTFELEDGDAQIFHELTLEFTQSSTMAQRIAKIELYRSREPITVTAICGLYAYQVAVGDVVNLTLDRYGWSAKPFECVSWRWTAADVDGAQALGIELTLRETSAAVYDWSTTDEQLLAAAPATSLPNWTNVDVIGALQLAAGSGELIQAGDGSIVSRIRVSWAKPPNAFVSQFEVRWKKNTDTSFGASVVLGGDEEPVYYISPVDDGAIYVVEVRALTVIGASSDWVSGTVLVTGKTDVPADIASIRIANGILTWDYPNPPADLAGFKVRYQTGNFVFWPSGNDAHSGLLAAGVFDASSLLSGTVTLMVKAVDTSGNESENPAVVVANLGDHIVDNVIYSYDLRAAGFPGTITAGALDAGDLAGTSSGLFWPASNAAPFWAFNANDPFWPTDTYTDIGWGFSYEPSAELAGSTMSIASTIVGSPWTIYYRETGTSLFWPTTDASLFWSGDDASTFWVTDGDLVPWPGTVVAKRTQYDFLVTASGGSAQPRISEFELIFDVPDVSETLGNVAVLAAGTLLPLTKTYRAIEAVQLTLQAGAGGAVTARVESKAPSGVLVVALNAAGTQVDATVDAIVQGY